MVYTILQNAYFVELVLPFILMFALVFAVLQKSKILGEGKRQVDAIVAAVVGLIVVAFGHATQIIVYLVPVVAVGLVILFLFMLVWGMGHEGKLELPKGVKWAIGIIAALGIIGAVIAITGAGDWIYHYFSSKDTSGLITNAIVIVVVIVVIVLVAIPGGNGKSSEKSS